VDCGTGETSGVSNRLVVDCGTGETSGVPNRLIVDCGEYFVADFVLSGRDAASLAVLFPTFRPSARVSKSVYPSSVRDQVHGVTPPAHRHSGLHHCEDNQASHVLSHVTLCMLGGG
jgi:hypothetical protein